ncbi:IQ motif, EF-hand binding site [Plasmopara halstedii]|uniref:IQ motif, EF-hand binding site n=1 Tax=Plasmopara halstedii TaxID=4781 RepID=A0A0N7L4U0_PLAHL|nr:IQ motif, EF-hand binding site [Plasmopara halstedii]CEG39611.1 IQ motif, EF-hand binding site [Plasmopara halstedii]|eukprot:XP_024575980.1 IQ motif, EF-hand binding site [Plasmopara halstedii]
MEEVDKLLDAICSRAIEVQQAQDPENKLRLLLAPLRNLFFQKQNEMKASSSCTSNNSSDSNPLSYITGAAAKFHKMILRSPQTQENVNGKKSITPPTYFNDTATRLHALVVGNKTLPANVLRGQQDQSEAATRIQALVRGKTERMMLTRQHSLMVQGTKVLKKYVLKTDRFPNCHELDTPNGDIIPNFRRLEHTPVYGSAQPSLEGIQLILNRVAADGFTKVVWINLREEAVIYVNGRPFTARRSAKLNENDLVPGITGHKIQVLELSMKSSLQEELKMADNYFQYWNEVAFNENELLHETARPEHVLTLPEIYKSADVIKYNDAIQSVKYFRIPIERENAPEHEDVETLMNLMESIINDGATAVVFNCQMGKRRTTTAMVLGKLIYDQRTLKLTTSLHSLKDCEDQNEAGNFAVIREVQKHLIHGQEAKRWVDTTIDECATVCNLRNMIREYRDLSNAEAKPAKRSYYLRHAMSFLERYFYLIVFGAYMIENYQNFRVKESAPDIQEAKAHVSFSKWLQQHPDLFRLLDDLGGVRYKSDKVLTNCVLKMDHFFGIARIPFELTTNVPNYRRIASEPIFGTAQCLEQGIIDVIDHLRGEFDRAIWINLREEAVIYVTGRPFCVRHQDNLMVNVEYPGIEVDEITAIEQQVKREVQNKVRQDNGLFMYWYEPREMVNEEIIEHIQPENDIKTLDEIYRDAMQTTDFDLRYARIPVSDETAPEEKDLDDMVRLVLPSFMNELGLSLSSNVEKSSQQKLKTAVIFNCQMGRGRTSTALVCVFMLRVALEDCVLSSKSSLLTAILESQAMDHRRQSTAVTTDFVVIRKLLKILENGVESKAVVDYAIDQCQHMQNLRDCISQCRDLAMDRDFPSSKRDLFMLRAVNYLERYFYLVCFASYLLEEHRHYFQRTLFVTWMKERYGSALYELLDNLCFEEEIGAETHVSSMRWRWRRKRKLISRLE